MPITLEVEFKGLCAFIERPAAEEIRVILVDSTHHHPHGGERIPKHTPLFVTPLDEVQLGVEPDFVMTVPGDEHFACWHVSNSDVEIDYSDVASRAPITFPGDLVLQGRPDAPDFPKPQSAWSDKAWVADIERILGPGQNADPKLFDSLRPATAASRWPFQFGSMRCVMPRNAVTRTTPFHFVPAQGGTAVPGIHQVFTDRVQYSVGFNAEEVAIRIGTRDVVLRDLGDGTVRAVYSNLPSLPSGNVDTHFSAYYDLLDKPLAAAQRPLPRASRMILGVSVTDCGFMRIVSR